MWKLSTCYKVINRAGGKWWSKDHHLVVIIYLEIPKNVDYLLKNVKKW